MKMKKESLVLGRMLQKIAPRIGATVLIEPEWGIVGQITFKSGRHSYFRYNTLDLNPMGGSEIARDKDYSNFFMGAMGYPTVPSSRTFFSDQWATTIGSPRRNIDAAYRYARKLGFPVIVKPNSGSQGEESRWSTTNENSTKRCAMCSSPIGSPSSKSRSAAKTIVLSFSTRR